MILNEIGGTFGFRLLKNEEKLPGSAYLGVAGMPGRGIAGCHQCQTFNVFMLGQTAFYAWQEYSKAKKGEVVYVTTGAGKPFLIAVFA